MTCLKCRADCDSGEHNSCTEKRKKKVHLLFAFLSVLLSWGDFKLLRYLNQNTARDLPLSWNQLSFCKGVSFWVTHFSACDPNIHPPETPCRQAEEEICLFSAQFGFHVVAPVDLLLIPTSNYLNYTFDLIIATPKINHERRVDLTPQAEFNMHHNDVLLPPTIGVLVCLSISWIMQKYWSSWNLTEGCSMGRGWSR